MTNPNQCDFPNRLAHQALEVRIKACEEKLGIQSRPVPPVPTPDAPSTGSGLGPAPGADSAASAEKPASASKPADPSTGSGQAPPAVSKVEPKPTDAAK